MSGGGCTVNISTKILSALPILDTTKPDLVLGSFGIKMAKKKSSRKTKTTTVRRRRKRKARAQPIQNVCNMVPIGALDATGSGATKDWYINAAWIMSQMNRKAFHQVTKDGHLKYYGLGIQVFNCVNASTTIRTAQMGYPTQNAVRAWHFARKERYSDAGFNLSDLGHGERLRFALDKTHQDLDPTDATDAASLIRPSWLTYTVAEQGEWDWSDVIITPPLESTSATADIHSDDLQNTFKLHLCGDHTETGDGVSLRFSHVGMIQSWTENRKAWSEPDSEETVQPENPLAFARMSESVSMRITEEVADEQKQSPPYSNTDDDDAESVFAELIVQGLLESKFPNPTTNDDLVVAPGGLAKVSITNNSGEAAAPYLSLAIYELS